MKKIRADEKTALYGGSVETRYGGTKKRILGDIYP